MPDTGLWLVFIRKVSGVSQKILLTLLVMPMVTVSGMLFISAPNGKVSGVVAVHLEGF